MESMLGTEWCAERTAARLWRRLPLAVENMRLPCASGYVNVLRHRDRTRGHPDPPTLRMKGSASARSAAQHSGIAGALKLLHSMFKLFHSM